MALATDMALVQQSIAFNPLQVDYGKEHVRHNVNQVVSTEHVESALDNEFFDAMTNVFGDDRPVHLPGRLDD